MIVSDYIDQGGPDTISTTWQQKGGRFTTPSNGAKVSIQLWIQLGSGWVTYDDVSLRPVVTYNLTYDAENRLTGVSGAATATFVYDGDGKRVKATAGGVTRAYVGDYFEWSGSTSTMVKYYYAGTVRVAMRTGSGTGTTGLNWLLGDRRDQSHFGMALMQGRALMIGARLLRERAQRLCWRWSRSKNDLTGSCMLPHEEKFQEPI